MRLNRLRMLNFRQHADTEIEFDLGLTGIIGPNGAGKSTILEAIAWALYGADTARGGKDTIRFSRAAARASVRVELDFELGGHRYGVVRGLTMAELYLDGAGQPIANSVTTVGDLLQRRIGMSKSEFFNTYFTGQKELAVMATLTATERAQFLSRVLGYEKLRTAQELSDARRRELRSEITGMRSGMPDAAMLAAQIAEAELRQRDTAARLAEVEADRERLRGQVDALAPRWTDAQRQREESQQLDGDLRVAQSELLGLQRNAERLTAELQHVSAAREALVPLAAELAPFHELGNDLSRMRDLAVHDGRRQALLEQERGLGAELGELREQRTRVQPAPALEEQVTVELEGRRRALEETQGKLELRRTEWVRDRQEAETRRNALRAQYAELKDQRDRLGALGNEGMCPTCQRPLGDHYRVVLDLVDSQLETVSADGSYFKSRLEQLEAMPEDVSALDEERRKMQHEIGTLERRLARVQMGVQQLEQVGREVAAKEQRHEALVKELAEIPGGYDRARHTALEQEFERLAALNTQANRLNTQVEREPALRREQESVSRAIAGLTAKRDELTQRRTALALSEEEFVMLRDQHADAAAQLHAATLAAMNAGSDTALAKAALDRARAAQKELERTEKRLEVLEADKRLHDELNRAYTDLRTDLNFAMRPELGRLASEFLTELTDARYTELELDDKYRIVVLEEGVPKPVISGGEDDMANLVLRLAISQMIAERAGQAFSLLVLDEIFGSLDETRRHHVVELLRGLQDRFEQVILITHIEGVRDGLDQVLEVRYDENTGAAVVQRGAAASPELFEAQLTAVGGPGDGRLMVARADVPFATPLAGPFVIGRGDIGPLNVLFSETFTERYRRDGLVGVRVPPLNPSIWQYAVADAGEGAMLWRDARGAIAAFNIAHRSGVEGWMGPLAVRDDCQGGGQGRMIVEAGLALLKRAGCVTIGLETMPRTMDNIGFYSRLGFVPGRLTVTLTVDAVSSPHAPRLLSTLRAGARDSAVRECAALVQETLPGFDYTREIELTHELALGDTLLHYAGDTLAGFALCHSAPLVEGRSREELRVLKLVARDDAVFDQMLVQLADLARRTATARVAIRLQGEYGSLHRRLISFGARVRWTDLRMVLAGYEERAPRFGIALTNWEI